MKNNFGKTGKTGFAIIIAAFTFCTQNSFAQTPVNVGINYTGASAVASALLDVSATNKGILIPRVALIGTTDASTISSPATSLLVYNDGTGGLSPAGYYYWNGSAWVAMLTGNVNLASSQVTGVLPIANGGTASTLATGSGSVVLATSPSLVAPALGVASATTINKITFTAPATSATVAITDGKTLTVSDNAFLSGTNTGDQTTITGNAGSSTSINITNDNSTNGIMYPTWVTSTSGNLPAKISSSKFVFNPSSGKVGISTNNPLTILDLGSADQVKFLLYGSGGTTGYLSGMGVNLGQTPNSMGFFIGKNANFSIDVANVSEAFPYSGYTSVFTILNSGNVGIGTTSPVAGLEVQVASNNSITLQEVLRVGRNGGTNNAAGNGRTSLISFYDKNNPTLVSGIGGIRETPASTFDGGIGFYTNVSGQITDVSSLTERMRIASNGNVGIGTTSPTSILDVETSASGSTGIDINNTATDGDPRVAFQLSGTSAFTMGVDDSDADKFKIGTTAVETNTRLTIDGSGNVGIGTTSPTSILDVETSASGSTGIDINNTATDGDPRVAFQLSGTSVFTMGVDDSDADKFKIGTTAIETNTRLTIDGSGNVGIGTTAPKALLSVGSTAVNSSSNFYQFGYGQAKTYTTLTRAGTLAQSNEDATPFALYVAVKGHASDDNLRVAAIQTGRENANNYGILALQAYGGRVGIGTDNPQYVLHVATTDVAKNTAGSWLGYSDERLKKNIVAFDDGLEVLRKVDPISYEFTGVGSMPTGKTFIGVRAQDIQKVAPYCVVNSTLNVKQSESAVFSGDIIENIPAHDTVPDISVVNALMYNYDGLIYVLINSVKTLDIENTTLKTELADLKARLEILEKK